MTHEAHLSEETLPKRKIVSASELDITPMIDVVFLLLIFFMVTSTMKQDTELQVPPAKHGEGVSTDTAVVITIVNKDNTPQIYLSDGPQGSPAQLTEVAPYVQSEMNADKAIKTVIIKADRELPSGYVEEVARAANEVEGIEKFYVGVQDKQ